MSEQQIGALTQRLARLEQEIQQCRGENRRWKRGAMLVLAAMLSIVLMGQGLPGQRVIEAEMFVLKDAEGRIRAVLGAERYSLPNSNHGLHLYTSNGKHVASLSESLDGAGGQLALQAKNTASTAFLRVSEGSVGLHLRATDQTFEEAAREFETWRRSLNSIRTAEEQQRLIATEPFQGVRAEFTVASSPKGSSKLELMRGSWRGPRDSLQLSLLERAPMLLLKDETGTPRVVLGYAELGNRATGGVEQRPVSSLVLFDNQGKVIWQAP
jgi:hypothetical protein